MDTTNTNTNMNEPFINGDDSIRTTSYTVNETYDRESWGNMIQRFYTDVNALFVREGQLIRTEMNEKITQAKAGVISMATAGVVLFVGVMCVAATAIILLNMVAPLWLSAVIVTVAFLAIGAVMLAGAKKALEPDKLRPNKSIHAFDEIRVSLKEKVNEITKH